MYKDLISRVKLIQEQNKIISELKQETFNVFSILRKNHDEDKLHSAFISELLNPKGSHGLNTTFVKLFFEEILQIKFDDNYTVLVDTEKKIEEGRTDIYIRYENQHVIVIENKIYAPDQTRQLIRYSNHAKNVNVDSLKLYYLTLYGFDASKASTKDNVTELIEGIHYHLLSYHSDIINWMELCQKEVTDYPTLRETIKQYIILLKKLTGQLTNNKMNQEIYSEIKSNYTTAKLIADNIWKVKEQEVKLFIDELGQEIRNQLPEGWSVIIGNIKQRWGGIDIKHKDWVEGVGVKLEGQSRITTNNSIYGIYAHDKKFDRSSLTLKFENSDLLRSGFKGSEYWAYSQSIVDFGKSPDIDKLFVPEDRKYLKDKIAEKMIRLSRECELILKEV